jgi:hypothetical protein
MSSESVCHVARSGVDVGSLHTRYFGYTLVLTYQLTRFLAHSLTPYSTVLLEKLTGLQLVKKFPTFYGTRITTFTSARYLSLP